METKTKTKEMNNYNNACTEVYAILNDLVEEDYNKIPSEVITAIKENRNTDYVFELDYDIDLKDNILLKETRAILFNLYRDYLTTPEQKEKIVKMQNEERQKLEIKKQEKYDSNSIFDKEKQLNNVYEQEETENVVNANSIDYTIQNDIKVNETTALTEVKKESFITKLFNKIKKLFKR